MEKNINISLEIAQDIFNLLDNAKHPHFESKIVEKIKSFILKKIEDCINEDKDK